VRSAKPALAAAKAAKVIFVEVPVGSQSARAMASYGICVGILGAIRAEGIPLIEVPPSEVKLAFVGDKNALKQQMLEQAISLHPDANFPRQRGRIVGKAEYVADAIAAIHAGVNTLMFQNLMRLYERR
jgi:Holliday junction resolvasome RuvABC endonuclease subunit